VTVCRPACRLKAPSYTVYGGGERVRDHVLSIPFRITRAFNTLVDTALTTEALADFDDEIARQRLAR
jgi:hypothetical protein